MPAVRDFSQSYHATNSLTSIEVPMPAYEAGDLLIAILSADTTTQTWTGGEPVSSAQYDDGGAFTDYTTAANNLTTADVFFVPVAPVVNDAFYIGSATKFTSAAVKFSTQGAGTWTITWEYWNGSTWTALSGVTDGTTGFKAAVTNPVFLTYTLPTNWSLTTVNSVAAFYIRGRVSAFTSISTRPIGTQIWVRETNAVVAAPWTQLFSVAAGSSPSNLAVMYKIAEASEVDTTFFYTAAETVNGSIISIRDVDPIIDSGTEALTISVVASAKTFTRSTGSFTTDGFTVGMTIKTSGFTNGGNNTTKIIESITGSGTIITVTSATGLVNETGNNNERVVSWPFSGGTGYATSNNNLSKQNMPTMTTERDNCLLLFAASNTAVSVPSIIEGSTTLIFGKDGSAHADAASWTVQAIAGTTPTVGMSAMSAIVTQMAVVAINPKGTGSPVIPGYCASDSSVYVTPFTGAAFNSDSVPAATITTPFTGTINGKTLSNGGATVTRADTGINSYHAMCNVTGLTTNGVWAGTRTTLVARTNIAAKNILFHVQPYLPVDIQTTDSVSLTGVCGFAIGLASTTSNFKVWHVGGSSTSWGTSRHQPIVINTDATTGLLQTTGTLNTASITEIGLMLSGKTVAPNWLVGSIWALDTCVIAGGCSAEPLDIEQTIRAYAEGHERRSAVKQGSKQMLLLGPIQYGDGGTNPVYLDLNATAIEFPTQYNKVAKQTYYNSIDNVCGITYYPGASDTIIHKNSVLSSASRYKWGLHASASTSATYDFSGLSVIGAGTINLAKAITITELTINDYSTIDASGADFVECSVLTVPASNDSITTTSATSFTSCSLDVSDVTAGNRWCSLADPSIFNTCTFTGGGGHALRITTTGSYTLTNLTWTSFGADASTGAAIYNDSGGLVTLTISGGTTPSIKNGASATTTLIINPVNTTITVIDVNTGSPVSGARVLITASDDTGAMPFEDSTTITRSGSVATATCTAHGLVTGKQALIKGSLQPEYNGVFTITSTGANTFEYTVTGTPTTPATGTIVTTGVVIHGTTNGSGIITDNRSHTLDQPITGRVRKATGGTLYKTGTVSGTIDNVTGFSSTVQLIPDQ